MEHRRSARIDRRRLLGRGAAAAGVGWLGAHTLGVRLPGALAAEPGGSADGDAAVLRPALELELLGMFVCARLLAGGLLGPAARRLAATILRHEQVHAHVLAAELARLGQSPPAAPDTVAAADHELSEHDASGRLSAVRREIGALDLLYEVEALSIGAYYKALRNLGDPGLMLVAAEIMGADAQHASAIGGLLHPGKWDRTVPVASVEGRH
ncbi:MAG: ferritin-like domain-containing protein [Solirubrobacterales bacterium]|nr:ferritin-like domain-containing protein [Solirubrobacterales bacterium]MBV9714000.1 ferritin-like domain-containing protein [Solirubrobacterales bacterium]